MNLDSIMTNQHVSRRRARKYQPPVDLPAPRLSEILSHRRRAVARKTPEQNIALDTAIAPQKIFPAKLKQNNDTLVNPSIEQESALLLKIFYAILDRFLSIFYGTGVAMLLSIILAAPLVHRFFINDPEILNLFHVASIVLPEKDLDSSVLYRQVSSVYSNDAQDENIVVDSSKFANLRVREHVLKPGDTLLGIALQFSLNMGTIASFNDIQDVHRMRAGATYQIPDRDGLLHTVRRGESVSSIASYYGSDINHILDVNHLPSTKLNVGDSLFIPDAEMDDIELSIILGELIRYPAQGRLTSPFGRRIDPILHTPGYHYGIDIANRPGTAIKAARAGRVSYVERNDSLYGHFVILSHGGGFETLYAHLSTILVSNGEYLNAGQILGRMGNTGRSTGPHLHFSVIENGAFVDPFKYLH